MNSIKKFFYSQEIDCSNDGKSIIMDSKNAKRRLVIPDIHGCPQTLTSLPYYYELEDCLIVHAGFNTNLKDPLNDYDEMLWIRDFTYSTEKLKNKQVIFGHTPTPLNNIKKAIEEKSKLLCLDGGAVFCDYTDEGFGNLICYDIDNKTLFVQPNLEGKRIMKPIDIT